MAEKEGFEPSRQLTQPTPLAGEPLRPLGYFSTDVWRRERDSNPRCLATSLVFKTSALNHSAISPSQTSETYYNMDSSICQCLRLIFLEFIFAARQRLCHVGSAAQHII